MVLMLDEVGITVVPGVVEGVESYRASCAGLTDTFEVCLPSQIADICTNADDRTYFVIEESAEALALMDASTVIDDVPIMYVGSNPNAAVRAMSNGADVFLHADAIDHFEARLESLHKGTTVPASSATGAVLGADSVESRAYDTLMESFEDHIYVFDRHGRFVRVNEAKAAFHDVRPADLAGKSEFEIFHPETAMELYRDNMAVIEGRDTIERKLEWVEDASGEKIHVTAIKHPITDDDGTVVGIIGISRNVSDLTKQQVLVENVREVIEHLYGIYDHNFRNRAQAQIAVVSHLNTGFEAASTGQQYLDDLGVLLEETTESTVQTESNEGSIETEPADVATCFEKVVESWQLMQSAFRDAQESETEMIDGLRQLVFDFSELLGVVKAGGSVRTLSVQTAASKGASCPVSGDEVTLRTDPHRLQLFFEQLCRALDGLSEIEIREANTGFEIIVDQHLEVVHLTGTFRDQELSTHSKPLLKLRLIAETLGWDIVTTHPTAEETYLLVDVTAWKRKAGAYD